VRLSNHGVGELIYALKNRRLLPQYTSPCCIWAEVQISGIHIKECHTLGANIHGALSPEWEYYSNGPAIALDSMAGQKAGQLP
jgi:hypothetical protein